MTLRQSCLRGCCRITKKLFAGGYFAIAIEIKSEKAFIGMNREIESGAIPDGSRVLFWHTGGGFGNFSYEAEWREALGGFPSSP